MEIVYEAKQGKREYFKRFLATPWENENFFNLEVKSRDKYADQMLPLVNTMIDSFRFTGNSTQNIENK
jgi:hypothetical protein